jgi:hypothetical protein
MIALAVTSLALGAMAVDHLLGDDPGLEDPTMFAISTVLSVAVAGCRSSWLAPASCWASMPGATGPGLLRSPPW